MALNSLITFYFITLYSKRSKGTIAQWYSLEADLCLSIKGALYYLRSHWFTVFEMNDHVNLFPWRSDNNWSKRHSYLSFKWALSNVLDKRFQGLLSSLLWDYECTSVNCITCIIESLILGPNYIAPMDLCLTWSRMACSYLWPCSIPLIF